MSSRTLWWAATMVVIAAIYFCSTPGTNVFGEVSSFFSRGFRQLGFE